MRCSFLARKRAITRTSPPSIYVGRAGGGFSIPVSHLATSLDHIFRYTVTPSTRTCRPQRSRASASADSRRRRAYESNSSSRLANLASICPDKSATASRPWRVRDAEAKIYKRRRVYQKGELHSLASILEKLYPNQRILRSPSQLRR